MKRVNPTTEERFWSYVDKKGGLLMPGMTSRCWQWRGATDGNYGEFGVQSEPKQIVKYAHAFAWELNGGLNPTRKFPLHHLCGNKLCVNPNHMAMVTIAGHLRLHTVTLKAQCKNGHPFDNSKPEINSKGYRVCRACDRERKRRQHAKKSAG